MKYATTNSATSATTTPTPTTAGTVNATPEQATRPAPLFPYLIKAVKKDGDERKKKARADFAIYESYLQRYLTPAKLKEYEGGKISRAAAVELATARAAKEIDKQTAANLAKIERAATAPDLFAVYISIEWTRSRVWGYNPRTEARTFSKNADGVTVYNSANGSASGCGYDKASAATSEAFNKCPELLKILYTAEEKRLKGKQTREQARRDFIGYGSGYSVLPYFEGGCGVSVYYKIFESCGYIFTQTACGKMFDAYTVTQNARTQGGRKQ